MFENEFDRLAALCLVIRSDESISRDAPIVQEYNEILEQLIKNGLSEPVDVEIEISKQLLSEKYIGFVDVYEKEHGETVFDLIQASPIICVVRIVGTVSRQTSEVEIEVVENWKGSLSKHATIGVIHAWAQHQRLQPSEVIVAFLTKTHSIDGLRRMPVVKRGTKTFALSYIESEGFWPIDTPVVKEAGARPVHLLVGIDDLRKLVQNAR